jgi:transposase
MNTEVASLSQPPHMTTAPALPSDLQLCHALIVEMHEQLVSSQRTIEQLEHRLDVLLRRMFGPRSERVDPNQLSLFEVSADESTAATTPASAEPPPATTDKGTAQPKDNGHGRRRFSEKLPRRRKVLDIPEEEKTCPCCGKPRHVIGEVVTERLGFDPARFYVNQYVQLKYGCDCEQSGVVTAEKPIQPIEKGNAEPELVAYVAVSRFDDHSPYYRQENGQFRRAGLDIPRSTQCDWMRQIGDLCRPLYDLMHERVLRSKLVGTDDTPVPVLVPGRGKTQQGHLWAWRGDHGDPFNVFDFTMNHSHVGPLRFLRRDEKSKAEAAFRGYLQADAGSPYDPIFRLGDGLIEVGCWAHTRRKFFEAKETNLACGMEALARVHQLYEVETAAKSLSSADRLALRQQRALPLLGSMKSWLDEQYAKVLPRSAMGGAIGYALGNWAALLRYTEDGDIPIDNNLVEQMLKLVAIGRKNWLFAGSERGGQTAAVLFTLISSAKRHKLNTWAYLRDVLWRLADLKPGELEELLPDRWRDSHPP